ncbi:MAG: hypothetical protein HY651_00945 [Acidobacteria bacterium]|nr:hypothetical protein [Acidobacteriota bacterium]
MAEFFFKFVPTQENLYDQFFKKLHPMRLMSLRVATLNYDRLLQLAARSRKIGLNYGGEPNWAEPLAPCLPHGTSYLASRMRMIRTDGGYAISGSGEINTMGAGLTIEGPLVELASAEELEKRRSEDFFPPAMSYVDPQKLSASGNSFLSQQQGVWASWVEHAERVAIVGVSVRTPDAPDAHLWKPLSTARAELLYVNPSNEECTKFRAWSAGYKRKDPDPIGETWEAASDKVVKFLRTRRTCGA